jgi:hypothetical protein
MTRSAVSFHADCVRIHREWHACARAGNAEGLLALYAEGAVLESPLVQVLLDDATTGVLQGRSEIRRFLIEGAKRLTRSRTIWHRSDAWMTDGQRLLVWEYPQETPDGRQLDIAEIMELDKGLIQKHRIYWGWYGAGLLVQRARGEAVF